MTSIKDVLYLVLYNILIFILKTAYFISSQIWNLLKWKVRATKQHSRFFKKSWVHKESIKKVGPRGWFKKGGESVHQICTLLLKAICKFENSIWTELCTNLIFSSERRCEQVPASKYSCFLLPSSWQPPQTIDKAKPVSMLDVFCRGVLQF